MATAGEVALTQYVSKLAIDDTHTLRASYARARPFPHIAIEDFFEPAFCEALCRDFPETDRDKRFEEYGRKIGKITVEDIRSLGETYTRLDDVVRSQAFLEWLSAITGIDGLLFDPDYVGGGTHENLENQALHPHVDFNHHPTKGWYRRLNLLVYLNRAWNEDWGGHLTLLSDPRSHEPERASYVPAFNRAVVFETTEHSWHGFGRLHLEDAPPGTTRRSISVYYYTEQPPTTAGPEHSTIYVPPSVREAVDEEDRERLIEETEALLRYLQQEQLRLATQVDRLHAELVRARGAFRVAMRGYLEQVGTLEGCYTDGWTSHEARVHIRCTRTLEALRIAGYSPGGSARCLRCQAADGPTREIMMAPAEPFMVEVPVHARAGAEFELILNCDPFPSDEERSLGFLLAHIEGVHSTSGMSRVSLFARPAAKARKLLPPRVKWALRRLYARLFPRDALQPSNTADATQDRPPRRVL